MLYGNSLSYAITCLPLEFQMLQLLSYHDCYLKDESCLRMEENCGNASFATLQMMPTYNIDAITNWKIFKSRPSIVLEMYLSSNNNCFDGGGFVNLTCQPEQSPIFICAYIQSSVSSLLIIDSLAAPLCLALRVPHLCTYCSKNLIWTKITSFY